ncbi:DUF6115 domain-containing protein [Natranaerobius thermophilus]|uniref:Uncharacterized protein n=1 Tax=Natranaerobius thermophilus (strain ATCC BAA-1301 / DSM 18059 / JW/NM-WN-LF) TaxID=457570 RepID=B2A378_NATTJ|nr:hypothetical protein [Natranaerobius thermophilus]ACB85008.1 hypothetical protein Nther_1425 [Natranaerobius thermophilus JW/NM-WN-LF]
MGLYITVFIIGVILIIFSTTLLKSNSTSSITTPTESRLTQNSSSKYHNNEKTSFLASEILREMEDSSEEMLQKLSSKEMQLESLISTADYKISQLDELLRQDVSKIEKANEMKPSLTQKQTSPQSNFSTYTPGQLIRKETNKTHNSGYNKILPQEQSQNTSTKSATVNFLPKYMEKHKDVIDLYKQGQTVTEIAQTTEKGKGEVQLIINLYQQSGENSYEVGS